MVNINSIVCLNTYILCFPYLKKDISFYSVFRISYLLSVTLYKLQTRKKKSLAWIASCCSEEVVIRAPVSCFRNQSYILWWVIIFHFRSIPLWGCYTATSIGQHGLDFMWFPTKQTQINKSMKHVRPFLAKKESQGLAGVLLARTAQSSGLSFWGWAATEGSG